MDLLFMTGYTLISILLSAADIYIAGKAFQRKQRMGNALGMVGVFAASTTLFYLCSVNAGRSAFMSFASSAYFISIDWMLAALIYFVYMFMEAQKTRTGKIVLIAIPVLACLDSIVLMVNVPTEIAVSYVPLHPFGIDYVMKPLYLMHLGFTYAMTALVLLALIGKCLRTPHLYRDQYYRIITAIAVIVIINAVFLFFSPHSFFTSIDCSVLGYSIGLYLLYWAAFEYRQKDMLKSLAPTLLEHINLGIVMFDHMNQFIMRNERAGTLLKHVEFREKMPMKDFLEECGVTMQDKNEFSTQVVTEGNRQLLCEYRRLKDSRDGVIGSMLAFSDISHDSDLITGFEYGRNFRKFVASHPTYYRHPTTVAVFDNIGLKEVNRVYGRDAGDMLIRELGKTMRAHMPAGTLYFRGFEAQLIAVIQGKVEKDLIHCAEEVAASVDTPVFFGISTTNAPASSSEGCDVVGALDTAYRDLEVKKLLSTGSVRSQALFSLVRALEESDSDTEEHVRRTQKMGAELGKKIGLCDAEQTELQLLCLLHDIGKIGIPLEILNKPGRLTDEEWAVLHTHPEKGYQIAMASDELKPIAEMILSHHERWDGKGYPRQLSGEDIPVLARIISIVDAYDAMVNDRDYRAALTPEQAQEEIRSHAGNQFDPYLAGEFLNLLAEHPDIAVGEKTGGEEVRVSPHVTDQHVESGSTVSIAYSRYLLDVNEVIIETDEQFEKITGYTAAEAVGKMTQFDLIPPADLPFYVTQLSREFAKKNFGYLRHNLKRKDGSVIQVVCYGEKYFDSAVKSFRSEILIFEV